MDTNNRNKGTDIIKALSLISVVIYHLYEFKGTYLSVIPFFVISGYMITKVLVEREDKYFSFIKNRIGKIYPPLITVLAFTVIFFNYFNGSLNKKIICNSLSSLFGMSNIYQIISGMSYFERSGDIFPLLHTWTLSIEIQFYLIFPFLVYYFKKKNIENKKASYFLFILSLISAGIMFYKSYNNFDISKIYYGTDTRVFSLLIGTAFYYHFKDKDLEEKKLKFMGLISLIIIFLSILLVDYQMKENYLGLMFVLSLASGFLLLAALKTNFLNFDNSIGKILSSLGKHSYVYYLWQYPIMIYSAEYFKWIDISYNYTVILQIIFLIIISEISYIFLEKRKNMAKKLGIIFLFIYITTIFISPFSNQTTADVIENRINEINLENSDKPNKDEKNNEKIDIQNDNLKENSEIDLMEKRLLNLEEEKLPKKNETSLAKEEKSNLKEKQSEKIKVEEKETVIEKKDKKEDKKITEKKAEESKEKITFIGDSVMKMAEPYIKKKFVNSYVDATVSRQFWDLPKVIENLIEKKKLNKTVIIHLGSNGVMTKKSFKKSMELLEGKEVYFINCVVPKHWEEKVNENLNEWSKEYDNIKIIDWYKFAKGKKELFYKDAIHPKPEGTKKYVELISENIK